MDATRQILFYKHFFQEFLTGLPVRVREKFDYVLFLIAHAERIPAKFFKHLEGTEGLYEIRVQAGGSIYRVFCCFDAGQLIILFNGFQKKTQKTPKGEIEKALRLMAEYFEEKES